MRSILVTGGAGYIGTHTCVELLNTGHHVVVFDNFSNSHPEAISRVENITGKKVTLAHGDVRDQRSIEDVIKKYSCAAVVHFAGLKAVSESVAKPLEYYDNNVVGTLCILQAMKATGIRTIVFSSSATVYGEPQRLPLAEDHPLSVTNPYGRSKLMIEEILCDLFHAEPDWHIGILRYFNPVGAHESGQIGEDPQGVPNNLMPYIAQVAIGRLEKLHVWGGDYSTPDGTGVRDYIHVTDLAVGHLKVLKFLTEPQCFVVNLGTGRGYSVLEVVEAFERVSGRTINYKIAPRRSGDVATCYADPTRAEKYLGWRTQRGIDVMCEDHWRWQHNNPYGYIKSK